MGDNNFNLMQLLSKADPRTIQALKGMAQSGQLDNIKAKLEGIDKAELIRDLSSFNKESVERVARKFKLGELANDPAVQQVIHDVETNPELKNDVDSILKN